MKTDRLIIRQWKPSDFDAFAHMSADPEVMQYFPAVLPRAQSDALATTISERIEENGYGFWAIELQDSGRFAGFTGLNTPKYELPFEPTFEIGWRLAREYWGKGLAFEAAKAALRFGFETLGKDEIVAFTATSNRPSRKLMERLGFAHTETENFAHPLLPADHHLSEHVLYRLKRDHWAT